MYAYFNNKNEKCLFALLLSSEGEVPLDDPHSDLWNVSFGPRDLASLATG